MNQKTALIVDDVPDFRFSVGLTLKNSGFNVLEARDGYEALEKLAGLTEAGYQADLIICDIVMPGMNGLDFLETIYFRDYQTRVIVMTGYGNRTIKDKLRKMGYHCIIEKPFSADALMHRVKSVFEQECQQK